MTVHYELPWEPTEQGFRVETSRGTRFDVPQAEPLAASMYDMELEWLWPGRVPFARLTLIEGPPGRGKSFAAISIAAIASSGAPWPGCPEGPAAGLKKIPVLFLSKARGFDEMFTGRIERAQADIDLCHRFTRIDTWLPESGRRGEREVVFPYDAAALGAIICDMPAPRPKLIVIDALTDYCPEPGQLEPWRELSEAAKWLRKVLAEGDLPATDVQRQARECGFSPKMLRLARQKLGVQLRRVGFGAEGHSEWSLGSSSRKGPVSFSKSDSTQPSAPSATEPACVRGTSEVHHAERDDYIPSRSAGTSGRRKQNGSERRTNGHAAVNRIPQVVVE